MAGCTVKKGGPDNTVAGDFTEAGMQKEYFTAGVTLDDASWTAVTTGLLTMGERRVMSLQNQSGVELKVRHEATEPGWKGTKVIDNGERFYNFDVPLIVYAKLAPASGTIAEAIWVEEAL